MNRIDDLSARWRKVCRTVSGGYGDDVYGDLVARYTEPHRAYHTLEHVGECLLHLDAVRHLMAQPVAVELAVWFHDAIYDPRRNDNEGQSALLARAQLQAVGAEALAMPVADLIRLTTHERDDLTGDEAILCDVDLAILGAEVGCFDRYDAVIRQEYDWVPDDAYRVGRSRVLGRFLDRPRIYQTQFFFSRFEEQARTNLIRAMARYSP